MKRCSGILLPIFSLYNEYGIGSFGKESYEFVDFLKKTNQKVWQILPLVQTGYGDSPYSSVCSTSFNPYFISVEELVKLGLLSLSDIQKLKFDSKYIDYGRIYSDRLDILHLAYSRFDVNGQDFLEFKKKGEYNDYALFMAIREEEGFKPFCEWESGLKFRDNYAIKCFYQSHIDEINFWQFIQFEASREWFNLKEYANKNGIQILGDMPLYVAFDSVDVWVNPDLFKLNEQLIPKKIAGVPPDYFSKTGQLWGNPVYNYDKLSENNFSWWKERFKTALKTFDLVRIDHFRGLDRYYEIDNGRQDATVGEWVDVPSCELFNSLHAEIDRTRIIAEDLGIIDDGVRDLLKFTGYPGMKVLSFAFNGESDNLYLPENINENSVTYTGTHDNDTLVGLIENATWWDKNNYIRGVINSLSLAGIDMEIVDDNSLVEGIINLGFNCKSNLFILPLFDLLEKGSDYRINEPGTVKAQNWAVRLEKDWQNPNLIKHLSCLTKKYNR